MASTLSTIQTLVRFEARDDALDLTSIEGLAISNMIYRRLGALIKWPELYQEDTSLSTVAEQEAYTWPSSVIWVDVTSVEMQDSEDQLNYKVIPATRTELGWNCQRQELPAFPLVYRRAYNGSNHIVQFAPKPKFGAMGIRITGLVEPAAFSSSASSTLFLTTVADHALAYMIAASYADKRNFPQRAQNLVGKAAEMLTTLAGREIMPSELKTGVTTDV